MSSEIPERDETVELYDAVGWTAYTRDPESLDRALRGSHLVVCARDAEGNLIGLIRTISDGTTIAYVQDLLVHPDQQRTGIGRRLIGHVLEAYPDVRQFVLLTDDEPRQAAFYTAMGLTEVHSVHPHPLRAFVRFQNS